MARSVKRGLDYFSMDVHMDDKFQLIEAEYGMTGFAVVVKLYQKIYGGFGYYCGWDSEVALLFARSCGLGGNAVSEIVNAALRRNIFCAALFDKYSILTSAGIQKRYLEATERRKQVELIEEYLLVDVSSLPDHVCIKQINVDINSDNAYMNPQSKVKESKGKQIKAVARAAAPELSIEAYAASVLNVLSPRNMEELTGYLEPLSEELIRYAIDEACAAGVRTWAYARSILTRFVRAGYKTVGDVEADKARREQQKQTQLRSGTPNPALQYEQRTLTDDDFSGVLIDFSKGGT